MINVFILQNLILKFCIFHYHNVLTSELFLYVRNIALLLQNWYKTVLGMILISWFCCTENSLSNCKCCDCVP